MQRRLIRSLLAVCLLLGVANCGHQRRDSAVRSLPPVDIQPDVYGSDNSARPTDQPQDSAHRPPATTATSPTETGGIADRLAALESPDEGTHCADGLTAADLTAFFRDPIGSFQGADYQRVIRLPDDRVLWTFQDAFLNGVLVHNAAFVQSGRCFTLLNDAERPWLFPDETIDLRRWFWPLAGASTNEGSRVAVFVVEMHETGAAYLNHPVPAGVHRVELDANSLDVVATYDEPTTTPDLYGWGITDDGVYSYLYSHCYRQFGYGGLLGFEPCVEFVKVARVPLGEFDAPREYWNGSAWVRDHARAAPVVDAWFVMSGNNPAQIQFDGCQFVLVEKRDDWWGTTVEFGVSPVATGPFEPITATREPLACDRSTCDTYFASWIPWREVDGSLIWSISCNVWDGQRTCEMLHLYGPTFGTVDITPP